MSNLTLGKVVTLAGEMERKTVVQCEDASQLTVTALGAGCEVGRSCIIVEYCGRVVMFDCGIHPGHSGIGALPVFDAVDVKSIDLCLITHFHLDHCGAVPYLVSKTPFQGKIIMTEPTKAIAKILWSDYAAMAARGVSLNANDTEYCTPVGDLLFHYDDIKQCLPNISTIDFRQTLTYKELDIQVTCYAAGHVLGACMFCVEINGIRILYTGDFSREPDRHVPVADIPDLAVNVLICESTYGIRIHETRILREQRLLDSVLRILQRSGKVLMPIFALGRAQELLLILEEYWEAHPEVQSITIWYCSPMSTKCMPVFEAFLSQCGHYVKKKAENGINPFQFRHVKNARHIKDMKQDILAEGHPCVVLAAPGMLQSGTSKSLFDLWCHDPRNGVILTGYSVKGTVADELKKSPHSLQLSRDGPSVQIKCSTEIISFSAHSDFDQTFKFIEQVQPNVVFLVHGERGEISRLAEKLRELRPTMPVFCPEILQKFSVRFPASRRVKVVGSLATLLKNHILRKEDTSSCLKSSEPPAIPSVLLAQGTTHTAKLVSFDDLHDFVPLVTVYETRQVEFTPSLFAGLKSKIETFFENVLVTKDGTILVEQRLEISFLTSLNKLQLSWKTDPFTDILSHAVMYLVTEVVACDVSSLAQPFPHLPEEDELLKIFHLALMCAFSKVTLCHDAEMQPFLEVKVVTHDNPLTTHTVHVKISHRQVEGDDAEAIQRVQQVLRRVEYSLLPLPPFSASPCKIA